MNTLDNNRSYHSSFIKRAAICILFIEWYMLFFAYFKHCKASPPPLQLELINPRKIKHKISDGPLVLLICLLVQYQTAVLVSLDKGVQFWLECYCKDLPLIPPPFNLLPAVGEKVVKIDRYQRQEQAGERKIAYGDEFIIHVVFWLIVVPLIAAVISILFTQRCP